MSTKNDDRREPAEIAFCFTCPREKLVSATADDLSIPGAAMDEMRWALILALEPSQGRA